MSDPFEFWNKNGRLEFDESEVKIFEIDGENYLFVGQTMFASTTERSWYVKNVMPHARGWCLEIGLGLGVASKAILAKRDVDHLLTVEKNEHVISAFGRPLRRHNILWADANEWIHNLQVIEPFFDFIFVDHYADMEEETYVDLYLLVEKLKKTLKKDGKLVVWIDENAPEEDIQKFKKLWVV